ncbi:hypothetical protein K439DRAFT_1616702 [Ramaria rubella]|nr:hypothetical protein K439DRAFT_1616702 [Ramaria rubella]
MPFPLLSHGGLAGCTASCPVSSPLLKGPQRIARILNTSLQVVQHVLKVYEEIGTVANNPKLYAKQGRARLLTNRNVEFLLALLERHPNIYLDELAEELNK